MNVVAGYNDNPGQPQSRRICRFYQRGMCRFGNRCRNVHCEVVSPEVLARAKAPERATPNKEHKQETNSTGQSSMPSLASNSTSQNVANQSGGPSTSSSSPDANASSSNKECGICFDTIMEKINIRDQTFGILPNCNHCFCFACIRRWRQSKEFDFDVSKACPECRKPSDYVYPSKIWFELKEAKDTFITKEKGRMQKMDCRYFNKGNGSCPFGNTCLYLHALPNGKKMDVGPPRPRRRRRTSNLDNEMLHQILYWLNDDDMEDDDDDDDDDMGSDFELDLDDPEIAMQYYDHDDIRRYIAIERLMGGPGSDTESDFDFPLFL